MTPDPHVHPEFYDGTPTKRLVAWGIDVVLIALGTVAVIMLTALVGLFFVPLIYFALSFAYRVITLSRASATWGMRLVALELRDRDDRPFDMATAFLHTLGYSLSVAMPLAQLVSIVMMCSSERRQGLTDMLLGTVALNKRA